MKDSQFLVRIRAKAASPASAPAASNGTHELEADRAAAQVMSMEQQEGLVSSPASPAHSNSNSGAGGGERLSPDTRGFFESRFGHDFSNVRVHADDSANTAARQMSARAFTVGEDIKFGRGEYRPETRSGRELLAHELAHVVQQSSSAQRGVSHGVAATMSRAPATQPQCKFIASGDTAGFVAMVNTILDVQFRVQATATGEISIVSTDVQGPPTRDATELLSALRTVIGASKTISIEFIHGAASTRPSDRNVIVGNYDLARIDLDDVGAFGFESSHSRGGSNAAAALVHEIVEQHRKQVHSEGFPVAHAAGLAAQERLSGARILNQSMRNLANGTVEGTTTYRYPDGREVDVISTIDPATGQMTNVRRVVRP